MRQSKPWLRRQNKTWYVWHNGRQVSLGKSKREAFAKFNRLMAGRETPPCTVRNLVNAYWVWLKRNRAKTTWERRKPILISFKRAMRANLQAADLKAHHVQEWVDSNWTNPTTRGDRITLIKGIMNWAVRMGFIESNPIHAMEKPTATIRQEFVPPDLWQKVLDSATDQLFRDWLFVMLSTGMRVTEMLRLEAKHFDGSKFVLPIADSKGRRRSRVIYPTADTLPIILRLADEHPEGKLFRNRRGKPFTRNSIRCRFRYLKKKLGMPGLRATTLRHSFAHYRLTSGQDSLTVAKLLGHVDTTMLARRYGHIEANNGFMEAAANQVGFPSLPSSPSNQTA